MADDTMTVRRREETGSRVSRRLRRGGEVPAVLGGLGEEPVHLAVPAVELAAAQRAGNQLVMLDFGDEKIEALIREVQWDTFGEDVLHVDFDRVKRGQLLELEIPIQFFGEPAGAAEGGIFQTRVQNVTVSCMPRAIPDKIEVDIREMAIGSEILAGDLVLPEGVALPEGSGDEVIAVLAAPAVEEEEVEEEEAEDGEPEVLTEKKADEEGAEEKND